MFDKFPLLKTKPLPEGCSYVHPDREDVVHLDSPALDVFTDFQSRPPETCKTNTLIKDALKRMQNATVRSLLVIDDNDTIVGHLSARDCSGMKPGQAASQHGVELAEVTAQMVMQGLEQTHTIKLSELSEIVVGQIARVMHDLGTNYLLVIEPAADSDTHIVRGLFAISRLSRQLGINLSGDLSSHSLADINRRLTGK